MATPTHGPFAGAYLASISVQNLRCFGETQRLDLTTPDGGLARWTLLLGDNGTGKTTLLQAMAACSLDDSALHPDRSSEGEFTPRGFPEMPFAHRRLGPVIIDTELGATLHVQPTLGGARLRSVETHLILGGERPGLGYEASSEVYELVSPAIMSSWFGYGPHRRLGRGTLSGKLTDPLAAVFGAEDPLVNAEEWYLQRDYASSNKRLSKAAREHAAKTRDRLDALIRAVLPDVTGLAPVPSSSEVGQFRLVARTPYGEVPVSELGLGYQSTLAWVVDLAARMMLAYPESDDPLAEPAVVLIDEIDLHLHPRWQRTLLAQLTERFPNTQFIATAHSPLVVQAAPDAHVAVLRRDGDQVVIDQKLPSVRHWRVDQILTSELFGLPSARDVSLDARLAERDRLLAKPTLSAADKARLDALREELGTLPGGDTPWEMRAMEVIRRAASALEGSDNLRASGVRERGEAYRKAAPEAPAVKRKLATKSKRRAR